MSTEIPDRPFESIEVGVEPQPHKNTYDRLDRVRREGVIIAGALKVAAYRVRDPEKNDEFGPLQFHMTYDNCVMAVMSENAAELFAGFVAQTLDLGNKKDI